MIDSNRHTRILLEVTINRTTTSPADTPAEADLRRRLAADVAAIAAKGGEVEIPGEFE